MKHYSLRTEQAYVSWIKRYILFHDKRHPAQMGEAEIRSFISDLASKKSCQLRPNYGFTTIAGMFASRTS